MRLFYFTYNAQFYIRTHLPHLQHRDLCVISEEKKKTKRVKESNTVTRERMCVCTHTGKGGGEEWQGRRERKRGGESVKESREVSKSAVHISTKPVLQSTRHSQVRVIRSDCNSLLQVHVCFLYFWMLWQKVKTRVCSFYATILSFCVYSLTFP